MAEGRRRPEPLTPNGSGGVEVGQPLGAVEAPVKVVVIGEHTKSLAHIGLARKGATTAQIDLHARSFR